MIQFVSPPFKEATALLIILSVLWKQKKLHNFDSLATNVSHCDSEPITVQRIQTGSLHMSQPCPWCRSCDQSAAGHTSGSHKKTTEAMSACISSGKRACCSWRFCSTTLACAKTVFYRQDNQNDAHLFQYVTARHDTWHWV